jgi:NAD(P)-dependent dehydrogenase (short-subunit alcohol dehydrogenase family)
MNAVMNSSSRAGVRVNAELTDKVVFVTGAARGIGEALVEFACQDGAHVVATDRDQEGLNRLASKLQKYDANLATRVVDITDAGAVAEALDQTLAEHGRIDGCFSNAGISHLPQSTHDLPMDLFEHVMRVNVFGCLNVLKPTLAIMREQGFGAIVTTASVVGLRGVAQFVPYAASKHAVVGMTRAAALEAIRYGVRVNALCPGFTWTPIFRDTLGPDIFDDPQASDEAMRNFATNVPMQRFATSQEIAEFAAFMLSDRASYMVGETVAVDGGLIAGWDNRR